MPCRSPHPASLCPPPGVGSSGAQGPPPPTDPRAATRAAPAAPSDSFRLQDLPPELRCRVSGHLQRPRDALALRATSRANLEIFDVAHPELASRLGEKVAAAIAGGGATTPVAVRSLARARQFCLEGRHNNAVVQRANTVLAHTTSMCAVSLGASLRFGGSAASSPASAWATLVDHLRRQHGLAQLTLRGPAFFRQTPMASLAAGLAPASALVRLDLDAGAFFALRPHLQHFSELQLLSVATTGPDALTDLLPHLEMAAQSLPTLRALRLTRGHRLVDAEAYLRSRHVGPLLQQMTLLVTMTPLEMIFGSQSDASEAAPNAPLSASLTHLEVRSSIFAHALPRVPAIVAASVNLTHFKYDGFECYSQAETYLSALADNCPKLTHLAFNYEHYAIPCVSLAYLLRRRPALRALALRGAARVTLAGYTYTNGQIQDLVLAMGELPDLQMLKMSPPLFDELCGTQAAASSRGLFGRVTTLQITEMGLADARFVAAHPWHLLQGMQAVHTLIADHIWDEAALPSQALPNLQVARLGCVGSFAQLGEFCRRHPQLTSLSVKMASLAVGAGRVGGKKSAPKSLAIERLQLTQANLPGPEDDFFHYTWPALRHLEIKTFKAPSVEDYKNFFQKFLLQAENLQTFYPQHSLSQHNPKESARRALQHVCAANHRSFVQLQQESFDVKEPNAFVDCEFPRRD